MIVSNASKAFCTWVQKESCHILQITAAAGYQR